MVIKNERLKEKIVIALDFSSPDAAKEIVNHLGENVLWYKVGMELFTAAGPKIIEELAQQNKKVFLDLKYHDIPNTVAQTAKLLVGTGVSMFNIHISGGKKMIQKTLEAVHKEAENQGVIPPKILGVTMLTSLDEWEFKNILGFSGRLEDKVLEWAKLAENLGLDGVVASPLEAARIKELTHSGFLIVTPGIRPKSSVSNDQMRKNTPGKALISGATHLVMGRPITNCKTITERKKVLTEVFNDMKD